MPAHVLNPAMQRWDQFHASPERNWTASPMGVDEIEERKSRLPFLLAAKAGNLRASYEAQVVLARDYRLTLPLQLERLTLAMRVEVLSWAKRGPARGMLCLRGSRLSA
jgi:hypothetical protein